MTDVKPKVLFLCTGNSCRSQMIEGWVHALIPDAIEPFTAGTVAKGIHPLAIQVMAEVGINIRGQKSKRLDTLKDQSFDYVVTVCNKALEACPVYPSKTRLLHVGFDDPVELSADSPSEAAALVHYRRVRDEIRDFVKCLPTALDVGYVRQKAVSGTDRLSHILFLCTHNAARSQMAEGLLRQIGAGRMSVYSAGARPTTVNPLAIEVMKEVGIDISDHKSKGIQTYLGTQYFNHVFILCDRSLEPDCPHLWPGASSILYWPLHAASVASENISNDRQALCGMRDELKKRLQRWFDDVQGQKNDAPT